MKSKLFFLVSVLRISSLTAENHDTETALKGVHEFLEANKCTTCYTMSGFGASEHYSAEKGFLYSNQGLDNKRRPTEICKHSCCYTVIMMIKGLRELNNETWSQFRMYVFVNSDSTESPRNGHPEINLGNAVIFQKRGRFFGVYEKKTRGWVMISVWDGRDFNRDPARNFRGERLRVGSSVLPLYTEVYTLPNGTVFVGDAIENVFFKAIARKDGLELKYVDVFGYDSDFWGVDLGNGSFTGLLRLLLEIDEVDMTSLQHMCAYTLHPNLLCSFAYDFDGIVFALKRPPPLEAWMGIISPYEPAVWTGISLTLLAATFVLGICHKLTLKSVKNDWPLHFLDALSPMAGRPMCVPGFNAAHLGRKRQVLAFEVFLVSYTLACTVFTWAYQESLFSHLTAKIYPKPVETLNEFADQPHLYRVFQQMYPTETRI